MVGPKVYPDELRERAIRLLHQWRQARGVTEGGYAAISKQLGLRRETVRRWVLEVEGMDPYRPGVPKVMTSRDERAADRGVGGGEPGAAPGERDPQDGRGFLRGGARPPTEEVVA